MPLPLSTLERLQAEAFADDIPIDVDRMQHWSEEQARRYFEGGGVEDGRTEPAAPVSAEGTIDQLADQCKAALYAKLPCIGHGPQLPGEALSEAKGCHKPKPEARVRLFALYGVADVAMSLQPWIDRAPEWLEVRLVDLPGHGFRQRDSALLSCAEQGQLNESALVAQRAQLVRHLSDEILKSADEAPFALYGFSFGALIMFEIAANLCSRASETQSAAPVALCVAGRGAPHCIMLGRSQLQEVQSLHTDGVLSWVERLGMSTSSIPKAMRSRSASLFRFGILLGAIPTGQTCVPEMERDAWSSGEPLHASQSPRLHAPCRLRAFASDADKVWPAYLVQRWQEAAAEGCFSGCEVVPGIAHGALMNDKRVMAAVFNEVLGAAATSR